MAVLKLPKHDKPTVTDKCDIIAAATEAYLATEAVHQAFANVTELDVIQDNLQMCMDAISGDCAEESLKLLNAAGDISKLLDITSEKLTVKAAQEGLGQAIWDNIKKMCAAISEFIKKLIARISSFFTGKKAETVKESIDKHAEEAKKVIETKEDNKGLINLTDAKQVLDLVNAWINDQTEFAQGVNKLMVDSAHTDAKDYDKFWESQIENFDHRKLYPNLLKCEVVDIVGYDGSTTQGKKGVVGLVAGHPKWKTSDTTPEKAGYTEDMIGKLKAGAGKILERYDDPKSFDNLEHALGVLNKYIKAFQENLDDEEKLKSVLSDNPGQFSSIDDLRASTIRQLNKCKKQTIMISNIITLERTYRECGMSICYVVRGNLSELGKW